MPKYILIKIGGVYTQIAKVTKVKGYTEGIIECLYSTEELSKKEEKEWIKENNNRMHKICEFLNENIL